MFTPVATIVDFFQSPLTVYLGLALATLLLLLISSLFLKEKETKLLPRGSMGWPVLGETLGFLKPHKSNTMGVFLQQHISRYGKVFKSHLFLSRTIVSGDLELNHFIFKNEGKLFQNTYPKSVKDIMGNLSLMLVLDGEIHKRLRTAAVNFIGTSKSSSNFIRYIEKLTILRLSTWKEHGEILFAKEAKKFVFHLMLKNLLNIEPGEPLASQLLEDYLKYMKGFVSLPLYVPGTPYVKGLKARARIASTVKGIIEERKKNGEYLGIDEGGDFLDEMLLKGELNNEETVSLVMDLLLAGYETTAGLLAVLLYFLAQAPQALEQLKQEHLALRSKKKDGETLTWEDIQQLEFNSYVIHEALRCGNLVKFLHRIALEDVKFKEYYIPKGWQVLPIFTAVHMDPSLHESPSVFNPWRWKDQSTSKKVNPFGGGKRQCPGIDLAKLEVTVFLHHLVLNYRWKMIDKDDFPVSYPYLDFKKGLKLEIKPTDEK